MLKNYFFIFFIGFSLSLFSQINYNGNGGTFFGGPVGQSTLAIDDDGTAITFTLTKGASDFNDVLVIYLDTGATGRNVIDSDVNDNNDPLRTAIANGDSSGFASNVNFAPGFEAFYVIGVSPDFIGLFSIPSSGMVGSNGLTFESTLVGNPAFNTTDPVISFSVDWSTLGLTSSDSFDFVGLYLSGTAFNSDEGYGDGITPGSNGNANVAFTNFLTYSQALSKTSESLSEVRVSTNGNQLSIFGVNDNIDVEVYNIMGQSILRLSDIYVSNNQAITLDNTTKGMYLVRLSKNNENKTFKVLLNN